MVKLLLGLNALLLLAAVAGGLLHVGVVLPGTGDAAWLGYAAGFHAALMICGFLGSVIGIERAVAVKRRLAFVAPAVRGCSSPRRSRSWRSTSSSSTGSSRRTPCCCCWAHSHG
jgi:hypothetical protein